MSQKYGFRVWGVSIGGIHLMSPMRFSEARRLLMTSNFMSDNQMGEYTAIFKKFMFSRQKIF